MGCVSSKQTVSVTPAVDYSGQILADPELADEKAPNFGKLHYAAGDGEFDRGNGQVGGSGRVGESLSFRLRNLQKYTEGEQVAAGWPAWLSAVAGEAIHGWVPLKSDSFEKLEKIGQGTYSSVFKSRELETGRIVALKKVRFDNFEPESVRFMAREILILRRLDHPNVMKLDGLITSRMSGSIYLVFEYMEHDITGLLSSPDVNFSESQIKCYMKQLLSGVEHCHKKGVLHRDIKGSNLLVNNEGILKVADFGLANFYNSAHSQPLTSRVVTLWYRPPELLLGSTDYGASVDLWSVGCVFAETLFGKPLLQGRTEVEQLHKIFKLCGSPPDEFWGKSKLPHATISKPQQPYDSSLKETFKDVPTAAVNLIETLLSVEPYKRGTASSALFSEYFSTKPYACEPSSLPKYPPSKEIDAKYREEKRKKISGRSRGAETKRPTRKASSICKLVPAEDLVARIQLVKNNSGNNNRSQKSREAKPNGDTGKGSVYKLEEIVHLKNASQGDIPFSVPLQVSSSGGFAWARPRKDESSTRSRSRSTSRGHLINGLEPGDASQDNINSDSKRHENGIARYGSRHHSRGHDLKQALQKQWSQFEHPDSFDTSDEYHSQDLSWVRYQREEMEATRNNLGFQDQGDKVDFSGPVLTQSCRVDELLERHERQIRQAVRRSWFRKGK